MTNENKVKSLLDNIYKTIYSLIPKTQLKGAIVLKTDKAGLYGIVFRNANWTKVKSKRTEIDNLLKDTDWNFSIMLSRNDDPTSMATGKNGMPLTNSFAYLGKDFRDIPEDTILGNDIQV